MALPLQAVLELKHMWCVEGIAVFEQAASFYSCSHAHDTIISSQVHLTLLSQCDCCKGLHCDRLCPAVGSSPDCQANYL